MGADESVKVPVDQSNLGPKQREIPPEAEGIQYSEWKASQLNKVFGRDSRIAASTVKHGHETRSKGKKL